MTTCYARPLALLLFIISVAMITAGMTGYLIITAAVAGGALVLSALLMQVTASRIRRARAASGACTTCRHPCQGEPVVFLDEAAVRWPDRPETGGWSPMRGREGADQ